MHYQTGEIGVNRAFEAGVNYVDTAVMYCEYDSERAVGVALKGWRDRIIVSTKNHYYGTDEKAWWQNLENSLERLDIDYIDIYNIHGVNKKQMAENVEPRIAAWMLKAHEQGLIRHICVSFHDNNEALEALVDSGYPAVITLQYNMLDRQLEAGMARAQENNIGIVVMGPVGGGRLGAPSDILESLIPDAKKVPELAMRFVLANPNVDVCLSGMSTMEQVEENIETANAPVFLTDADKAAIEQHLDKLQEMADLYCTGCRYCMPCSSGVEIPAIFDHYNLGRVYGLWDVARKRYANMVEKERENHLSATACTECEECEEKCPQNIPIREQLKEAHKALTAED